MVLELALQVTGVAPHPHDHVGDPAHGEQGQDPFHRLALLEGETPPDHGERDGDREGDRDRRRDADPHRPQGPTLAPLDQERGDDPHDQRRFEPFPEPDHEGR